MYNNETFIFKPQPERVTAMSICPTAGQWLQITVRLLLINDGREASWASRLVDHLSHNYYFYPSA